MLYIRPGTHALTLLQLLSVAGEFPVRALRAFKETAEEASAGLF